MQNHKNKKAPSKFEEALSVFRGCEMGFEPTTLRTTI
jgi:hypothetical protein